MLPPGEGSTLLIKRLAIGFSCVALAACGAAIAPALTRQALITPTRTETKPVPIVKIREFSLPPSQLATFSIIVGPDRNLWFTEERAIARMTVTGKITEIQVNSSESDPGFLTPGADGSVWVSTATYASPFKTLSPATDLLTGYQILQVTPELKVNAFTLPYGTDAFPSNLVTIDHRFYFGNDEEVDVSGSDVYRDIVATISSQGKIKTLFQVNTSKSYPYFWLNAVTSPGPLIWLYSHEGTVSACTIDGKCRLATLPGPEEYADGLHPESIVYSPVAQSVYVANQNYGIVDKLSLDDKVVKSYSNGFISTGYAAVGYYGGNVWITLGPDSDGRPLLARLTPSGDLSMIALPIPHSSYGPTALVAGPDGHLWYLRGLDVGEVLSKI
jgi:streptogramin lyase